MLKRVRGSLFVDYVRMMRAHKSVDWARHLTIDDLAHFESRIVPSEWYPMETFERMGVAILAEIAQGDLAAVTLWGRASIDWLSQLHPNLFVPDDPRESLMRFQVLRRGFFDFPALEIDEIDDFHATVRVSYGMGRIAEEAASHQTMGFFTRLLEVSGAKESDVRFTSKSWTGDVVTKIAMTWKR